MEIELRLMAKSEVFDTRVEIIWNGHGIEGREVHYMSDIELHSFKRDISVLLFQWIASFVHDLMLKYGYDKGTKEYSEAMIKVEKFVLMLIRPQNVTKVVTEVPKKDPELESALSIVSMTNKILDDVNILKEKSKEHYKKFGTITDRLKGK